MTKNHLLFTIAGLFLAIFSTYSQPFPPPSRSVAYPNINRDVDTSVFVPGRIRSEGILRVNIQLTVKNKQDSLPLIGIGWDRDRPAPEPFRRAVIEFDELGRKRFIRFFENPDWYKNFSVYQRRKVFSEKEAGSGYVISYNSKGQVAKIEQQGKKKWPYEAIYNTYDSLGRPLSVVYSNDHFPDDDIRGMWRSSLRLDNSYEFHPPDSVRMICDHDFRYKSDDSYGPRGSGSGGERSWIIYNSKGFVIKELGLANENMSQTQRDLNPAWEDPRLPRRHPLLERSDCDILYYYDDRDRLSRKEITYPEDTSYWQQILYTYTADDLLMEKIHYKSNLIHKQTTYHYNTQNLLIRKEETFPQAHYTLYWEYEYRYKRRPQKPQER